MLLYPWAFVNQRAKVPLDRKPALLPPLGPQDNWPISVSSHVPGQPLWQVRPNPVQLLRGWEGVEGQLLHVGFYQAVLQGNGVVMPDNSAGSNAHMAAHAGNPASYDYLVSSLAGHAYTEGLTRSNTKTGDRNNLPTPPTTGLRMRLGLKNLPRFSWQLNPCKDRPRSTPCPPWVEILGEDYPITPVMSACIMTHFRNGLVFFFSAPQPANEKRPTWELNCQNKILCEIVWIAFPHKTTLPLFKPRPQCRLVIMKRTNHVSQVCNQGRGTHQDYYC